MNKGGRPPYQPTLKDRIYIEALASYGVPEDDIARVVGINRVTLHKYYRDQIENGHIRTNAMVAGFLFTAAKKGSVPAMMFWLRCRAGWQEPRVLADELGKKELAAIAAKHPDTGSPFGQVIADRARRKVHVGLELSRLGTAAAERPIADTRSAA